VGPNKYNNGMRTRHRSGNRSSKKLKNKISEIKKMEPGKPKNTSKLRRLAKNSLGHRKLTPLISVNSRVLNLRFIASTKKNELEERRA
jgi:hypothetical protein